MLDLFGDFRRKTMKDIYKELNEMLSTNEFFSSEGLNLNEKTKEGSDKFGNWKKTTFTSEDGSMSFTSYVRSFNTPQSTSTDDTSDVKNLKSELEVAIEEQNFEKAAELRDKIKKIQENEGKISELQSQLDKSIKEQNFEESIKLRDKINKLKS